ncbi:MAG TPA: glycosyltransferase family 4 protein [Opitutaceae bacterium]|nr:glycosyltransferase family 4 protein [Opitutaceae bacterium]
MSARPPPRLAVVLSHPIQYYSPWFQWLRARTGLPFRVFYLWDFGVAVRHDPQFRTSFRWDVDLLEGYDSEFVPNRAARPGPDHFRGFDNPQLASRLEAWRPDAVLLFGYKWLSHLRVVAWARRRRVPLLFRGDSHLLGRPAPRPPAAWLQRTLFAQFAAFLPVGRANRDYFRAFGVPERKLFFAPHAVDHRRFDPADPAAAQAAARLRRELEIAPERRVVLFAAKFTPAKQPGALLRAFLELRRSDAVLVLAGGGEEEAALQGLAAGQPQVRFLPFANQSEMPARYRLADLFALPSRGFYETWGLAVNEAMHLGVPALVSERVGCQQDLVTEGETGWVFRSGDEADLRGRLGAALDALADPARRAALRAAVLKRISGYTYEQTTGGLEAALEALPAR